jgi:hypothetical protein
MQLREGDVVKPDRPGLRDYRVRQLVVHQVPSLAVKGPSIRT